MVAREGGRDNQREASLHTLLGRRYTTITIGKVAVGLSPTFSALQAEASILGHATNVLPPARAVRFGMATSCRALHRIAEGGGVEPPAPGGPFLS